MLIYGANGYTGELIIRRAVERGLKPIIAGRNEEKIKALAEQYDLPFRIFALNEPEKLDAALREVSLVLHCAGPFMYTARPMMEACLRNHKHYLDITGEMAIFEMAASMDAKAKNAGIMIMPGTGFDVVPTDCLALRLKKMLPDATHLRLAFANKGGGLSHGTAITMAENLDKGGAIRKNGIITPVPNAYRTREIPFSHRTLHAMTIPWGDVSTAWYTTGIPNIEVYLAVPPSTSRNARWAKYFGWLLRQRWVKDMIINRIKRRPAGPSDEQRTNAKTYLWGEVENAAGVVKTALLETAEGYTLTAMTSVLIAEKILAGNFKTGYQTPAGAYGEGLVDEVK